MSNLKYITCGHEDCSNGHAWGPGIQPDHVIQYVLKGKGFYEIRGKRYSISQGQCFYIVPGEITHYYPDMSDPWIYMWIRFGGVDAEEIMEQTTLPRTPVTPPIAMDDIFALMTQDAIHPHERLKNEGCLHMMLSRITEHFPERVAHTVDDYVHLAKRYINANLNRPDLSVSELARAVGLERSYLFRLFREGCGISVKEYIITKRLESACDMFRRGVTQVGVVAYSCGYENPLYFSGVFKKRYGVSPREYINKLK